jgi:outer membrane immunogenic protein
MQVPFRRIRLAWSGALLVGLAASGAASAAPPPVYNWTGMYIGAHAGYGWGDWDVAPREGPFDRAEFDTRRNGAVFGGQIGYNFQYGSFVFGPQARFSWFGGDATASAVPSVFFFGPADYSFTSRWTASVQGRLGVGFDRTLIYLQGGFAASSLRGQITFSDLVGRVSYEDSKTRTGGVLGGGIEYAITPNFSVGTLVQHYWWGDQTLDLGRNFFGEPVRASVRGGETTARVEFNYRFAPPPPPP